MYNRFLIAGLGFVLLFTLFQYRGAEGSVGHDIGNQTTDTQSVASTLTFSHTVASGSNQLLIVATSAFDVTDTDRPVTSVTFNGVSLTQIASSDQTIQNITTELWYLVAPNVTTANVIVTFDGANAAASAVATNFTNVDQTTPIDVFETQSDGSSVSSYTITATTTVANTTIIDIGFLSTNRTVTPDSGTQIFEFNDNNNRTFFGNINNVGAAGGQTIGNSFSAISRYVAIAAAIKPAEPETPNVTGSLKVNNGKLKINNGKIKID